MQYCLFKTDSLSRKKLLNADKTKHFLLSQVNKDGTVTEEEEVETLPSTGYSVTGIVSAVSFFYFLVNLNEQYFAKYRSR